MKDVWRIHLLALEFLKVYTIALGICFCISLILLSAYLAKIPFEIISVFDFFLLSFDLTPQLLQWKYLHYLLISFLLFIFFWSSIGAGITRIMALDFLRLPQENLFQATKFCLRPALILPSFLASLCFVLIFLVKVSWLFLLPVLPLWLYAGFIYAPLSIHQKPLSTALTLAHKKIKYWRQAIVLQTKFIKSFFISTGLVYLVAILAHFLIDYLFHSTLESILSVPILLYALGYTTSNLKSLQIYLYTQLPNHD